MKRPAWILVAALLASLPAMLLSGCSMTRSEDVEYIDSGEYRFSSQPRMMRIADSDVYYIRDRSDYDVYQFEGTWYLNDNGTWLRASSWRGPFVSIQADVLPNQITTVPSNYRRNWVAVDRDYMDRYGDRDRDRHREGGYWASGRTFRERPGMREIPGTSIRFAYRAADYDLYRLSGTYYLVDDGGWYRASSWRGPFISIRFTSVPNAIRNIPARYRREWSAVNVPERRYGGDNRYDDRYATVRYWSSGRTFTTEPQTFVIGDTGVDYYRGDENYEVYRYGSTWYLVDSDRWYRADSWRGPYISIQAGNVPRAILTVPVGYRHYWTTD